MLSTTPQARQFTSSEPVALNEHRLHDESFFRFTRGRFLTNEAHELAQRYVRFNVDELANVAVRAAEAASNAPRACISVGKLGDGMHNKVMRFTMDNGFQVVGKVPNPNAGLPHFTTASEVATMDFMRNVLGTPVPKVLAWSSSTDNPVAAEYILMENPRGIQLSEIWDSLGNEVKFQVLEKVAYYQDLWSQARFPQYGSLYYRSDLRQASSSLRYMNKHGKYVVDCRFAVGPGAGRQSTKDGRAKLDFFRGPWETARDYERAIGSREAFCVRNTEQLPPSPFAIHYSRTYFPSRQAKLFAARSYLKVVDYLLPEDEEIAASCLWHGDLRTENIFVNPEDPSEIFDFVDWQSTELAPLYQHTIEPSMLQYNGPRLEGLLDRPNHAAIKSLFKDEGEAVATRKANSLFISMALLALYRHLLHTNMPRLFKALEFRQTTCFDLLSLARRFLVDGEVTYLELLAKQQAQNWTDIPRISRTGQRAPLRLSQESLEMTERDAEGAAAARQLMRDLKRSIGTRYFLNRGFVSHAEYAELERILPGIRNKFVRTLARSAKEKAELANAWPFDIPARGTDKHS
ncbi:hypothetical protein BDW74DRAFT_171509 [Aspergillus multicolor]|uniref:uncharacterized protein n=1 Tax=Aspergillus multicolor TaxID=41759 RepID=UPI003CCD45EC